MRASLTNTIVLRRRLNVATPFAHVVADRLLDVNVFTGLHGPDRGQGVPVVSGGDGDRVNLLVLEDAPHIGTEFESTVVWMHPDPLDIHKIYLLKHTTRTIRARVKQVRHRIDVKRLVGLRPIKNKMEMRLDDNKIHIFGARRTNVTGLNARELHARNWHCQNLSKVAISASTFATAEGGRVSGFYSGE